MGLEAIVLRSVEDDPALLRAAFEQVLRPSFGPEELPGWDELAVEVGGPDGGDIVVIARDGRSVAGVAVTGAPDPGGISLLSYLAARPHGRSRGVGRFLMEQLQALWSSEDAALVLGEVHDPRVHAESDDEHPAARLRFYERHGATVLGPWVQPALVPGADRVEGMLLLSLYRSGRPLPPDTLTEWAEAYFALTEGAVPTDPSYRALQRRLSDVDLGSHTPLSDYESVPLLEPTTPPPS